MVSKGRMIVGTVIFTSGMAAPLLIPVVTASALDVTWKTLLSGLLAFGIPELFVLAAVAVMGKDGYDYLKWRLFRWLREIGPRDLVSATRYRIGLIMFCTPMVLGFAAPYVANWVPYYSSNQIVYAIIGDLMLLSSLFILGGDFWDKLRSLFVHGAKARFPTP